MAFEGDHSKYYLIDSFHSSANVLPEFLKKRFQSIIYSHLTDKGPKI